MLLLSSDPAWAAAARLAIDRSAGESLQLADSPTDALDRLVTPSHVFSHLLLEPSAAGPYVRDLLGVTAGEVGSQVELILLGAAEGWPAAAPSATRPPRPIWPASCIRRRRRRRLPPALSTSDIAVAFSAGDVECRFQPIVRLADRRAGGDGSAGPAAPRRTRHHRAGPVHPADRTRRPVAAVDGGGGAAVRWPRSTRPSWSSTTFSSRSTCPWTCCCSRRRWTGSRRIGTASGIPVQRILIELTESRPVIDIPALAQALDRWRQAGYRVAIDDMGPEMINQVELFDLPFNVVKLDKQVVLRSETDPARPTLSATHGRQRPQPLARIIAEGIENEAMWNRMRDMGVEYAQGFLIARALPAAAWPRGWRGGRRRPCCRRTGSRPNGAASLRPPGHVPHMVERVLQVVGLCEEATAGR